MAKRKTDGDELCPCESGKKYKDCHGMMEELLKEAEGAAPMTVMLPISPLQTPFPKSNLSPAMQTKLLSTQAILVGHLLLNDVPISHAIEYSKLTTEDLDFLEARSLHPREAIPLSFEYVLLEPHLPTSVDKERFFSNLSDILYNEWAINQGRRYFVGFGFEERTQQFAEHRKLLIAGLEQLGENISDYMYTDHAHVDYWLMRAKWFTDDSVFRIRAQWDKLLRFLATNYFGVQLNRMKLRARINEFTRKTKGKIHSEEQERFVNLLMESLSELLPDTHPLKQYRDAELHLTGKRAIGAFEHEETKETVYDYWRMVVEEHNKVREALMIVFAVILSGAPAPP